MGLFGFLGDVLGSNNSFHTDPLSMPTHDYANAINTAEQGALGSINNGNATGAQQATLAQQLAAQANGQGDSLAQLQLQQAEDQNLKNNAALIAGVKGINPAQAARQVALSNASQGQNLANQSAQLRLQEQTQKQNLLAQTLASQRGADISQQGANQDLYGMTGNLQNAQNNTNMNNYYNAQNINAGIAAQNTGVGNQMLGGVINGVGAMIGKPSTASPKAYSGRIIEKPMEQVAVSPGEKIVSPSGEVKKVPGDEVTPGDSPKNDTVIADLRKDSIVVPKSKADNKEKMIEFISKMKKSSNKKGDLQTLLDSHNEIKQKLEELNYKLGKWMPK